MFELLAWIQRRDFLLMSFLSKSERNILCKCRAPDMNKSRTGVMDVEYKDEILNIQQYLVATSTNSW